MAKTRVHELPRSSGREQVRSSRSSKEMGGVRQVGEPRPSSSRRRCGSWEYGDQLKAEQASAAPAGNARAGGRAPARRRRPRRRPPRPRGPRAPVRGARRRGRPPRRSRGPTAPKPGPKPAPRAEEPPTRGPDGARAPEAPAASSSPTPKAPRPVRSDVPVRPPRQQPVRVQPGAWAGGPRPASVRPRRPVAATTARRVRRPPAVVPACRARTRR